MKISATNQKRVFLDHASATPIRPEVREVCLEYENRSFANPSALYQEARDAKETLSHARKEVALTLNTTASQIVFTSGGTEANNIAVLGVFEKAREAGIACPHIISVVTEHPAVREVLTEVERRGGKVTLLPVTPDGRITARQVSDALTVDTVLVSVMYVNNEIGVLQPVREVVQTVHAFKKDKKERNQLYAHYPYIHSDACQAPLWYGLDMSTLGVDVLSLDGLKIGGPRGVGCLYVHTRIHISPVMFGGGQENGLRSGTEDVAKILGFACALTLAKKEKEVLSQSVCILRDDLWKRIQIEFPDATLNGSLEYRAPNNLNVCFAGVDAEHLVVTLDVFGVCVSYSSSCRTLKEDSSSYVVEALNSTHSSGKASDCMLSSIRFTLGRETTQEDIDNTLIALKKAVEHVKE